MTAVRLSKRIPILTWKSPNPIQVLPKWSRKFGSRFGIAFTKQSMEISKETPSAPVDSQSPPRGSFRPMKIWTTKAASGTSRIKRRFVSIP